MVIPGTNQVIQNHLPNSYASYVIAMLVSYCKVSSYNTSFFIFELFQEKFLHSCMVLLFFFLMTKY